jgi:hypothetical protein
MENRQEFRAPFLLFQKVPTWVIGLVLIIFGLLVLFNSYWFTWLEAEQRTSISDALLVAGLLAAAVDPFIKGRLYREVAAGTFHYLLGFAQPREIQDALRRLAFETKLYARDLRIDCRIEREEESSILLWIRSSVRIENPTSQIAEHEPKLSFEEMERPIVDNITVKTAEETRVFPSNLKPEPGGIRTQHTDRFVLGPNESMMISYVYAVKLPDPFFHSHYFGTRTIGVTLSITAPGHEVSSDLGGESPIWERPGLSMIGDHFTIRWKPRQSLQGPAER